MDIKKKIVKDGFTLIEILVVLSLVALLSAILFAAFSRVREKSRSGVCQSNLKQLALAIEQYVQDHDGRYPDANPDKTTPGMPGTYRFTSWTAYISSYIRNTQILLCPTREVLGGITSPHYTLNILRLNSYSAALRRTAGRHEAGIVDSSKLWMNSDESNVPIENRTDEPKYSSPSGCGWMLSWGQTLHSGGANYSFADGHVKWLMPQQIQDIECGLGDFKYHTS